MAAQSRQAWTNEALKDHFDKLVNLILTRMQEMQAQWDRSTDLAREATQQERQRAVEQLDARLAGLNEFRAQMADQAARFVTRREAWGFLAGAVGLAAAVGTAIAALIGG